MPMVHLLACLFGLAFQCDAQVENKPVVAVVPVKEDENRPKVYCYYREIDGVRVLDFQWIVDERPTGNILIGQTFRPTVRMRLRLEYDPKGQLIKICVTEA